MNQSPSYKTSAQTTRMFTVSLVLLLTMFASALTQLVPGAIAEPSRWALLVLCIVVGLNTPQLNLPSFISRAQTFQVLCFGMLLAFGLSVVDSLAPAKSMLYLAVCALQVILFTHLAPKLNLQAWRAIFLSILLLCAGVCAAALLGYSQNPDRYVVQGRLAGTTNANSTALIAMVGAIIGSAALLSRDIATTFYRRLFLIGCIAACLPSLVLTGSRSSLGGVVVGLVAVAIVYGGVSRLKLLLFGAAAIGPALLAALGVGEGDELASVYARGDTDDILFSRREVWEASLNLFSDYPWFGSGYAVHDNYGGFIDGSGYHGLLASVGLVGALAFLLVVAWVLVSVFNALRYVRFYPVQLSGNKELLGFAAGCFAGLVAQGIGEPWTIGPGAFAHVIFWLSAGACMAAVTVIFPPLPSAATQQTTTTA